MGLEDDYIKYRGKCKEMSERLVASNPDLVLVRGHYHCPIDGKLPHWWTRRQDGTIIDPSARQFKSKGIGVYEEFNGMANCSECGKEIMEEEIVVSQGNYIFCSGACFCKCVGITWSAK